MAAGAQSARRHPIGCSVAIGSGLPRVDGTAHELPAVESAYPRRTDANSAAVASADRARARVRVRVRREFES